jgi:enoyl-CoA hydratase/carnithine racemase
MLFTGDPIDAKQAFSAGLVAKVSAEDELGKKKIL